MLHGQYCYKCQDELGRKVQAYHYEKSRFGGFRLPLCKMHKRLESSAFLRIQRAKWLRERRLFIMIRDAQKRGSRFDTFLCSVADYNAIDRLKRRGLIRFSSKGFGYVISKKGK